MKAYLIMAILFHYIHHKSGKKESKTIPFMKVKLDADYYNNKAFSYLEDVFKPLLNNQDKFRLYLKYQKGFNTVSEELYEKMDSMDEVNLLERLLVKLNNYNEIEVPHIKLKNANEIKKDGKILPLNKEKTEFIKLHPQITHIGEILSRGFLTDDSSESEEDLVYAPKEEKADKVKRKREKKLIAAIKEIAGTYRNRRLKHLERKKGVKKIRIDGIIKKSWDNEINSRKLNNNPKTRVKKLTQNTRRPTKKINNKNARANVSKPKIPVRNKKPINAAKRPPVVVKNNPKSKNPNNKRRPSAKINNKITNNKKINSAAKTNSKTVPVAKISENKNNIAPQTNKGTQKNNETKTVARTENESQQNEEEEFLTGYHPVKIAYENSLMIDTINKLGIFDEEDKSKILNYVNVLIEKADSMIRKYIYIKDKAATAKIGNRLNINCHDQTYFNTNRKRRFNERINTDADVIVFIDGFHNKENVLAVASACDMYRHNTKRAQVGFISLNLNSINYKGGTLASRYTELTTVVHEMFHIFGFSQAFNSDLKSNDMKPRLKYLPHLKKVKHNPMVDQSAHWNSAYLVNDIMTQVARVDGILSVFSIEYLDNISDEMRSSKKYLQNNYLMDELFDYDKFFNYDCNDQKNRITEGVFEGNSKFKSFCTKEQRDNKPKGCDRSHLYKTDCSWGNDPILSNNCYENKAIGSNMCIDSSLNNSSDKQKFEYFGDDSRCFASENQDNHYCLKVKIEDNNVVVIIEDRYIICKEDNAVKEVIIKIGRQRITLNIICPNIEDFKKMYNLSACPSLCHANGHCSNGTCVCYEGYDPSDNCKSKLEQRESSTMFITAFDLK